MVNFTIDEVRDMMKRPNNIRNISVIAHVDHGKTTLTDSLISKAGIISEDSAGEKRYTQTKLEEQLRGITIKSAAVSLYYERENDEGKNESYLVNLIDSPGHIDFSSEVTAALRVTDGALVVVDCIEGPRVQTETVLRQAIAERIKPILFLNKLDRIFLELNQPLEECYKNFRSTIESVNVVINTYYDPALGNIDVLPEIGTVGFGSGLMAWGFTLKNFAKMYSSKFGLSIDKLMKKLWGENYWDSKDHQWVKTNHNETLERSFNQFVLGPVKLLCESIMKEQKDVYIPIIQGLQLKITKQDYEKCETPKDLLKVVMRKWLPAGDTLLDMITNYLPSPVTAQKYRVENLYSGPLDTFEAQAIRFCDVNGPMSMYITKMFPSSDKKRFIAFGRVFSGVVKVGQEVRICGPDYEPGKKNDLYIKKIQRCLLMMGRYDEQIPECPAGNVCGVLGVSEYLLKSGTLTTSENMYPFHTMKFSVAAVVQVAVETKNPKDLPKLLEGLKALSHSDQIIKCYTDKLGQHIVAGSGTLHLNTCLKDLKDDFMNGIDINVSQPTVSFAETITSKTGEGSSNQYPKQVVSKAPNKLNRLYVSAEPLDKLLIEAIDNGTVNSPQDLNVKLFNVKNNNNETELNTISQKQEGLDVSQDNKKLSKEFINELIKDYNFDIRKLWTFGCVPDAKTNILVDMTKGLQHMDEIKPHIISAFMMITNGGVLCDEIMRGTRFNIEDALIHSDPMHRGVGQMVTCARKAFYAAQIASNPKLLEPIYLVEITTPIKYQSGVFLTINSKRGTIIKIEERINTPLISIQSHLPVIESFNFNELLRKNTGGQAFEQMKFSHWSQVSGDPFINDTLSYNYIMDIRKRKGLKLETPLFYDYYDKV